MLYKRAFLNETAGKQIGRISVRSKFDGKMHFDNLIIGYNL